MDDDERRQTYQRLVAALRRLPIYGVRRRRFVAFEDTIVLLADELLTERRRIPQTSAGASDPAQLCTDGGNNVDNANTP